MERLISIILIFNYKIELHYFIFELYYEKENATTFITRR